MKYDKIIERQISRTTIVFLILYSLLIGFASGVITYKHNPELFIIKPTEEGINNSCKNDTLIGLSECLNSELRSFWKYNISTKNSYLSDDELKESGGVCWHATDWYKKRVELGGYWAEEVTIITGNVSHQFLIASSNNSYCLLDQEIISCYDLIVSNNNKIEVDLK